MRQLYLRLQKIMYTLALAISGLVASAQNPLPISQDKASNYAEGEFTDNFGRGMGFVPWQFLSSTTETSGYGIGSSTEAGMGDVNTDGKAFMLYGYEGQGVSLARYFRGTGSVADPGDARSYLLPGQVFSIKVAIGNRNGYKGLNITEDDGSTVLVTFANDNNTYRFGHPMAGSNDVNATFPFDVTSVFTIEATQLTSTTCEIKLIRGSSFVSTGPITGKIGGFSFYEGSTWSDDPQNRLYFNNLLVERRCPDSTTFDGSTWSNGLPDLTKQAIVTAGTLVVSEDMEMCTLTITGTAEVVVEEGINLTVANTVNVAGTASMTVENNANLIQIDNVQNTGNITVLRNSSAIRRLDYTLWSSPVTGQNLFGFSPQTLPNRFYTYNSTTNYYNPIPSLGTESATTFAKGHGYLIRVANNHPATTPTEWPGEFNGQPNSGTVSVPLNTSNNASLRYNLIGNPYPSAISIQRFIERNEPVITGQVWFWRKTNNPQSSSYCTVTAAGLYVGNPTLDSVALYDPRGVIRTGQGFFVEAKSSSPGNVIFNNSLREADNSNRFFRTAVNDEAVEMNRFWLSIGKEGETLNQMLVSYMTGATNGIDYGIDGKIMDGDGVVALCSLVENNNLSIQGRGLPFSGSDVVTLGLRADEAGTYNVGLDRFDGLFAGQDIYLKDNLLGTSHNIKNGAYEFTTEAGTFTDRFEVIYAAPLNTGAPEAAANSIIVYKSAGAIAIHSGNTDMESIAIYDLRGRMLYSGDTINAAETTVSTLQQQQQMLIVQVVTKAGAKISKKILF